MITKLINEYKDKYLRVYSDDFEGKLHKLIQELSDPSLAQNTSTINLVQELAKSLRSPLQIGIIGQFSSGKSTFLNLILGKNILPTGVIPVTFMPTYLRYHSDYVLGVEFDDRQGILTRIDELATYTDQRASAHLSSRLTIYSPSEILKQITFVDTPGLNANEKDEQTTKNMLKDFHLIIWLSLAQNAGKKSEQELLASLNLPSQSICLINQKDKLNQEEQDRLKAHCDEVFGGIFKHILLISCKMKEQNKPNSGYDELIAHLNSLDHDEIKQEYIKSRLSWLLGTLKHHTTSIKAPYESIKSAINAYTATLRRDAIKDHITVLQEQILIKLKQTASTIADYIQSKITTKQARFYTQNQSWLHKDCYTQHSYELPNLLVDNIYSDLFYNQDKFNKQFLKTSAQIKQGFNELKALISQELDGLSHQLDLLITKYSSFSSDDEYASDGEFIAVRGFMRSVHTTILGDMRVACSSAFASIDGFADKLELKAFNNFSQATRLALCEIYEKIQASREWYEIDNANFSLYLPSTKDIYERLLASFNFYEFEQMIERSYLGRIYADYVASIEQIASDKCAFLDSKITQCTKQNEHFDTIFENVLKG